MFSSLNLKTSVIKNIVFDFAGVIVTCQYDDFVKKAFPDLHNPGNIKKLSDLIFKSDIWTNYDKGLNYNDLKIQLCDLINSQITFVECNQEDIDNIINAIKELMLPMEETVVLIKELKKSGMRIYGLTNMPKEIFDHLITTYEFFTYFSGMTSSSYTGLAKPDKPIYERLLKDNNIIANETVFLDDRLVNLLKAKEIGIETILFENIQNVRSELNKKLNNTQKNFLELDEDEPSSLNCITSSTTKKSMI